MPKTSFKEWFVGLTGHQSPRNWQEALAAEKTCRSRLIRIPTGLGKTEGVLAAWSFHCSFRRDNQWPLRLVWCLPMRVLVEQTVEIARGIAAKISEPARPSVHVVMGGEDGGEWFLKPENPAVIIGTQDMLLSRALNRGYASARARWPMEFGLLNQDALWVMDEVQLMDVGLATAAQLQAFRDRDCSKHLRPCHTWWMSATLQPEWLRSVDTTEYLRSWVHDPCEIQPDQHTGGLWDISKSATTDTIASGDDKGFARRILEEHNKLAAGEFGKITLVVCNTVDRACCTFDALRAAGRTIGLELVHSRFRPAEREAWRERFLCRSACTPDADRIIGATQVVEAGVDISTGCLVTELAPWPSLVQRFGRCARFGGSGNVLVIDRGREEKKAVPYQPEELDSAWETLQHLHDVGIADIEDHERSLSEASRRRLYPYSPAHLLLRKEFDELFDTTPDLTGADLDISRFIRSGDERDLHVFWLDIPPDRKGQPTHKPPENYKPHRLELCAIPFLKAREWLCTDKKPILRNAMRAWVWDWIDGVWIEATREKLIPGQVVCVASASGGYETSRGFNAESTDPVPPVSDTAVPSDTQSLNDADDQQDSEQLSLRPWKTIAWHAKEVATQVGEIAEELGLPARLRGILELAALWHDWGKSHPAFQGSIRSTEGIMRLGRMDLAKAPDECWSKKNLYRFLDDRETRPGFRHELASVLGLFALLDTYAPTHDALLGPWLDVLGHMNQTLPEHQLSSRTTPLIERLLKCRAEEFDLVAYLVGSHHGKVRVGLQATPKDQDYRVCDGHGLPIRGIREGDRLPSVTLVPGETPIPEVTLTLSPALMGLSCRTGISWRERCIGLMERHGPASLSFLEAILRAADVRASRLSTNDPTLAEEGNI